MTTPSMTIEEIIGQLAGSASMCWEPTPTGVFDSEHASKYVLEAIQAIREVIEGALPDKKPKGAWGNEIYNQAIDDMQARLSKVMGGENE